MKVNPIQPIRRAFFKLRYDKASLVDVATGKETPYASVTEAWQAKQDFENGRIDILC